MLTKKKDKEPCWNCGVSYPGHLVCWDGDDDNRRCIACQKNVGDPEGEDIAAQRCENMALHIRMLFSIYIKSLKAELSYRDGILKQMNESMARLMELDAEYKSQREMR